MDNIVITITPFITFLTISEIFCCLEPPIMKPQFIEFETLMMQYLLEIKFKIVYILIENFIQP